jgi:hypothetical protein
MPIPAVLAVLAGVVWMAAGLALNSMSIDALLGYKDSSSPILVAAAGGLLGGLAAFIVSLDLPGRHRLASVGATAMVGGSILMLLPWPMMALGFFAVVLGGALFGATSRVRTGVFGILLAIANIVALGFNTEDQRALLLIPLGLMWMLLGIALAVRRAPIAEDAPPAGS